MDEPVVADKRYPLICTCCRQAIMRGELVYESSAGRWHGPPKDCVNGLPDSRD